ncbi:hypothetical protein ACHAXH_001105 [Discostella pseudostelligera]
MHGQKRSEYKSRLLDPETSSKLATKAQQWNHLSHELLTQRRRLFLPQTQTAPAGANANAVPAATLAGDDDNGVVLPPSKPSPKILVAITEKMLSVNPDPSHLWNIRREMLLYVHNARSQQQHVKKSSLDIQAELALTAHCLQRNPKSYSAWYHRKWSLVYSLTHPTDDGDGSSSISNPSATQHIEVNLHNMRHLMGMKTILSSELELCAHFLQLDEHKMKQATWWISQIGKYSLDLGLLGLTNPRQSRWVLNHPVEAKSIVSLSQEELDTIIINEWDFTTSKIHDNFSNGSAFHYRSKLLPLILESRLTASANDEGNSNRRYATILGLAREEWESILLNAIFTEPDDQTPWWYHRFIVSWMKPSSNSNNNNINKDDDDNVQECEKLLYEMADSLRELLEVEKENDVLLPLDGDDENINNKDESKGSKCKWAYIG